MEDITRDIIIDFIEDQLFQDTYCLETLCCKQCMEKAAANKHFCFGFIDRKGSKWVAHLLYLLADQDLPKQKWLHQNCRTEAEAKIVLAYAKQFAMINKTTTTEDSTYTDINLN